MKRWSNLECTIPALAIQYREYVFIALLLAYAFWLRFANLGDLGFLGDEDHTYFAVKGVLEKGFPLMPSGAIYPRGILYTYLTSFSASLFGLSEFSLRLPSVVASLLVICLVYVLAKEIFGYRVALLASSLLCVSAWNIEMARTARMYEVFLLFWVLSVFVFYRGFLKDEARYRLLVPVLFVITMTIHPLGVFLSALFVAPLLLKDYRVVRYQTLVAYLIPIPILFFVQRKLESYPYQQWRKAAELSLPAPTLTAEHLTFSSDLVTGLVYLIVVLMSIMVGFGVWSTSEQRVSKLDWVFFILLSAALLVQNFAVAFWIFSLTLFKRHEGLRNILDPVCVSFSVLIVCVFLIWFVYGFIYTSDRMPDESFVLSAKTILKRLIGISSVVGFSRFKVFPMMSLVVIAGLVMLFHRISIYSKGGELIIVLAFAAPWVAIGVLNIDPDNLWLRHVYMTYPFFLLIFAWTMVALADFVMNRFAWNLSLKNVHELGSLALAGILAFSIGNYHSVAEAKLISQRKYSTDVHDIELFVYRRHPDHKDAGLYVREKRRQNDIVIVMDIVPAIYAGEVNYLLRTNGIIRGIQATKEIWIGSPIVRDLDMLVQVLRQGAGKRVWLITCHELIGPHRKVPALSQEVMEFLTANKHKVVYTAEDAVTQVYLWDS